MSFRWPSSTSHPDGLLTTRRSNSSREMCGETAAASFAFWLDLCATATLDLGNWMPCAASSFWPCLSSAAFVLTSETSNWFKAQVTPRIEGMSPFGCEQTASPTSRQSNFCLTTAKDQHKLASSWLLNSAIRSATNFRSSRHTSRSDRSSKANAHEKFATFCVLKLLINSRARLANICITGFVAALSFTNAHAVVDTS